MPYCGGMCGVMKLIKRIFLILAGIVTVGCLGILICALNPSLTDFFAGKVKAITSGSAHGADYNDGARGEGNLAEGVPGIDPDWLPDRENAGYLVSVQEPDNLPDAVEGLTGYTPVNGEAQQVLPEEADTVAPGETGEGLDFDRDYYPYYAMLQSEPKALYRQIYANANALNTVFTPVCDVELDTLRRVFEAVYNDHPELFWLDSGFSCKYLEDGTCVEISLQYNETVNDMEAARQMFESAAESILSGARAQNGDFLKERYVHDALAGKVEYDGGARMNQSAYSGLVTLRTVCAGYSRAFQYIMQQLGIPCYYCTGYAGEDHAWNIVKLDGEYYNVDVTWDDTEQMTYDYFNRTDGEFAPTHRRTGLSVYLPACMGTKYGGDAADDGGEDVEGQPDTEESLPPAEPMRPLTWNGKNDSEQEDEEEDEEAQRREILEELGLNEDEVMDTMEEYYADCAVQMRLIGVGEGQFSNVVPESLWKTVELAYTIGSYKNGYSDKILDELGADNYYIQIQLQNLGHGYYRVYHNIVTY